MLNPFRLLILIVALASVAFAAPPAGYTRKSTWQETLRASIDAVRQGVLPEGIKLSDWSCVGPFSRAGQDNSFPVVFAPEQGPVNLTATFDGGLKWAMHPEWKDDGIVTIGKAERACYYLARTITVKDAVKLMTWWGSDDGITIWLNGRNILAKDVYHWCQPDQYVVPLDLNKGDNQLLVKISNGEKDAAYYFSLRAGGGGAAPDAALEPLWGQLAQDFPESAAQVQWIREDHILGGPAERFYRYDEPRVTYTGEWQYDLAGGPNGIARRSERGGDSVSIDFVGTGIDLLHKEGRLERNLILGPEAEQLFGLAEVALDGQPLPIVAGVTRDAQERSIINTSQSARIALARGLPLGPHRLTVTNLGKPSHEVGRGGSTVVSVMGFYIVDEVAAKGANPPYLLFSRGGAGWQKRAGELAGADSGKLEPFYLASREVDALAAKLRAFHEAPPQVPMVQRERAAWSPSPAAQAYLDRLAAVKREADRALAAADAFAYDPADPKSLVPLLADLRRVATSIDECLAGEVRKLPPVIFFTGAPLESGATPNYVWQSNPRGGKWGCSIRICDPAKPSAPAKVIFEDPRSIIFDMNLSADAHTVFFSMRRDGEQYWQIYEMSVDGGNLKRITSGDHYNVCPVPLPDGRLAFLSSRTRGSHTVCQSGPSMHVYVMDRDGANAYDLSTNTLTDFGLSLMRDGRLLFTRWEYVDADLSYRQSLWTQYADGRQFALYFGNTVTDPAAFWQAREIPNRSAVVCTYGPHHGSPYGAIGIVTRRFGVEAPRDRGFRWVTEEFPCVEDINWFWAYRDPFPISDNQFLVSYGGGGVERFRIFLLDEMDNKVLVYDDPGTSCFYPQPLRPATPAAEVADTVPAQSIGAIDVPAAPPGQPQPQRVPLGRFALMDVYQGLAPDVQRGRAASIRIMEQLPKTVNTTWHRVYDQGPLMSAGTTYYAKRCWGYAPVEADGSAYFEAPAGKELYFQVCDAQGRELRRMTSGTQVMPNETQSCIGCHESRDSAPANRAAAMPMAMRRPASPLRLPEWGNAGVIDYARIIQPILDRRCIRCHSGGNPAGGVLLTGDLTRFFNMSYDNLVVRSQSAQVSTDLYFGLGRDLPLVQFNNMFPGIYTAHRPLSTGSLVSRLPDYFKASHCQATVSADEMRRLYEWIDAMAPYYTTYYSARPGTRGDRDRWGRKEGPELGNWYAKEFRPVYDRRCAGCHGGISTDARYEWGGKWAWIDLTSPESSPALTAHLAKSAGGRGITEKDFGKLLNRRWTERRSSLIDRWISIQQDWRTMDGALRAGRTVELFNDTTDPDYQSMLQAIRAGKASANEVPEADTPNFVNRTGHLSFGGK